MDNVQKKSQNEYIINHGINLKKRQAEKKMTTCVVRADSSEELRKLCEVKCAELLAQQKKIVRTKGQRVRQLDLFNIIGKFYFECLIIWE